MAKRPEGYVSAEEAAEEVDIGSVFESVGLGPNFVLGGEDESKFDAQTGLRVGFLERRSDRVLSDSEIASIRKALDGRQASYEAAAMSLFTGTVAVALFHLFQAMYVDRIILEPEFKSLLKIVLPPQITGFEASDRTKELKLYNLALWVLTGSNSNGEQTLSATLGSTVLAWSAPRVKDQRGNGHLTNLLDIEAVQGRLQELTKYTAKQRTQKIGVASINSINSDTAFSFKKWFEYFKKAFKNAHSFSEVWNSRATATEEYKQDRQKARKALLFRAKMACLSEHVGEKLKVLDSNISSKDALPERAQKGEPPTRTLQALVEQRDKLADPSKVFSEVQTTRERHRQLASDLEILEHQSQVLQDALAKLDGLEPQASLARHFIATYRQNELALLELRARRSVTSELSESEISLHNILHDKKTETALAHAKQLAKQVPKFKATLEARLKTVTRALEAKRAQAVAQEYKVRRDRGIKGLVQFATKTQMRIGLLVHQQELAHASAAMLQEGSPFRNALETDLATLSNPVSVEGVLALLEKRQADAPETVQTTTANAIAILKQYKHLKDTCRRVVLASEQLAEAPDALPHTAAELCILARQYRRELEEYFSQLDVTSVTPEQVARTIAPLKSNIADLNSLVTESEFMSLERDRIEIAVSAELTPAQQVHQRVAKRIREEKGEARKTVRVTQRAKEDAIAIEQARVPASMTKARVPASMTKALMQLIVREEQDDQAHAHQERETFSLFVKQLVAGVQAGVFLHATNNEMRAVKEVFLRPTEASSAARDPLVTFINEKIPSFVKTQLKAAAKNPDESLSISDDQFEVVQSSFRQFILAVEKEASFSPAQKTAARAIARELLRQYVALLVRSSDVDVVRLASLQCLTYASACQQVVERDMTQSLGVESTPVAGATLSVGTSESGSTLGDYPDAPLSPAGSAISSGSTASSRSSHSSRRRTRMVEIHDAAPKTLTISDELVSSMQTNINAVARLWLCIANGKRGSELAGLLRGSQDSDAINDLDTKLRDALAKALEGLSASEEEKEAHTSQAYIKRCERLLDARALRTLNVEGQSAIGTLNVEGQRAMRQYEVLLQEAVVTHGCPGELVGYFPTDGQTDWDFATKAQRLINAELMTYVAGQMATNPALNFVYLDPKLASRLKSERVPGFSQGSITLNQEPSGAKKYRVDCGSLLGEAFKAKTLQAQLFTLAKKMNENLQVTPEAGHERMTQEAQTFFFNMANWIQMPDLSDDDKAALELMLRAVEQCVGPLTKDNTRKAQSRHMADDLMRAFNARLLPTAEAQATLRGEVVAILRTRLFTHTSVLLDERSGLSLGSLFGGFRKRASGEKAAENIFEQFFNYVVTFASKNRIASRLCPSATGSGVPTDKNQYRTHLTRLIDRKSPSEDTSRALSTAVELLKALSPETVGQADATNDTALKSVLAKLISRLGEEITPALKEATLASAQTFIEALACELERLEGDCYRVTDLTADSFGQTIAALTSLLPVTVSLERAYGDELIASAAFLRLKQSEARVQQWRESMEATALGSALATSTAVAGV